MSRKKTAGDYVRLVKLLRRIAKGFDAADGFDLRNTSAWTPSQKAKVTRYASEAACLTAQPHVEYHGTPEAVKAVWEQTGIKPSLKKFKVGFVPWHDDGSGEKPRIRISRNVMVVSGSTRTKRTVDFDPLALALDPVSEVKACRDAMGKGIEYFTLNMGMIEQGIGLDLPAATKRVIKLMNEYDGQSMPARSKNKKDNPSAHDWRKWLKGLNGYTFTQRQIGKKKLLLEIERARERRKAMRRKERRAKR